MPTRLVLPSASPAVPPPPIASSPVTYVVIESAVPRRRYSETEITVR